MTRTHTCYFGDDELVALRAQAALLRSDFEKRKPFIDRDHQAAIEARLAMLDGAVRLLAEWAD